MKIIAVVVNFNNSAAQAALGKLRAWARRVSRRARLAVMEQDSQSLPDSDLAMALGGDGTFLRASRLALPSGTPVLGINTGGLGFLTAAGTDGMAACLERFLRGGIRMEQRMMLEARLIRTGRGPAGRRETTGPFTAGNDVVVKNGAESRPVHIALSVDGRPVAGYFADGLIVSTPMGSTAYALSCGGPILSPDVHALLVAPICPHQLTQRPLVVPASSRIEMAVLPQQREVILSLDGQVHLTLKQGDRVSVRRCEKFLKVVPPPGASHFEVLRRKLKWGLR